MMSLRENTQMKTLAFIVFFLSVSGDDSPTGSSYSYKYHPLAALKIVSLSGHLAMGNCTVKGNAVACSPREAASAANCSVRRAAVVAPCPGGGPVRVVTGSGGVLEFEGPVDVGEVLKGYPGYGIFRRGAAVSPMFHWERLHHGRLYYLLPCTGSGQGELRWRRLAATLLSNLEVLPPVMKGVWRVRVAMDAEDLAAVFAEEVDIEALIERMRVLAATTRGLAGATKS